MEAKPFAGVAMPLNIKAVGADPVEAGEERIELLAEIVPEAGAVALDEAIFERGAISSRPSSSRSWRRYRSGSPSRRSTASCPCAFGRSAPGPRPSASRCCSPAPSASASRGSSRHCRAARSCAARRWLPSSTPRRRSARLSRGRARPRASRPSRTPSRASRAADASACVTARNDREPCRGSTRPKTRRVVGLQDENEGDAGLCGLPRRSLAV